MQLEVNKWICMYVRWWNYLLEVQKTASVLLSTTEAEYYALGIACQEAVWIKQFCQELLMPLNNPIHIYSDNTGMIALSNNPAFHNRSKHINIQWHFVRDLIHSKTICTSHMSFWAWSR